MTATATIQVAFIDEPDPPKRMKGRIKDTAGEAYTVAPVELGKFEKGRFYEIEFDEFTFKGGGKGKSIKKVTPRAQERPHIVQPDGTAAPQPSTISAAEFQFVTRVLCARISTCAVGGTHADILNEVRALRYVYREGMM